MSTIINDLPLSLQVLCEQQIADGGSCEAGNWKALHGVGKVTKPYTE